MKKFLFVILFIFAFLQASQAQPKPQDTSDIIWHRYLKADHYCHDARFSPDGNFIYAAINNLIVKLSAKTGDSLSTFKGQFDGTERVLMDFSALGNYIVTKDYKNTAMLWDCKNEKLLNTFSTAISICIDPFERYFLNGGNNIIFVYDPKTQLKITEFTFTGITDPAMISTKAIKISHDGTKLAIAYWYETINSYPYKEIYHNAVTLFETGTWKKIDDLYDEVGSWDASSPPPLLFSYDDKLLTLGYFAIDLSDKKIIKPYNGVIYPQYIGFYPDSIHFLLYYVNGDFDISFEFYNSKTGLIDNSYKILDGLTDCDRNYNQILANGGRDLTVLIPSITSVEQPNLIKEKLIINNESKKLNLELTSSHYGNSSLELIDLNGNKVLQKDLGIVNLGLNKFVINENLPIGVYFCKIQINNYSISQKFQIRK